MYEKSSGSAKTKKPSPSRLIQEPAHVATEKAKTEYGTQPCFYSRHPEKSQTHANTSHLTTLVNRFLKTLQNMKFWSQLDTLKGEAKLRHHLSNIIEYTFYFHKQHITEQEVEKLIHLLRKEGPNHEAQSSPEA